MISFSHHNESFKSGGCGKYIFFVQNLICNVRRKTHLNKKLEAHKGTRRMQICTKHIYGVLHEYSHRIPGSPVQTEMLSHIRRLKCHRHNYLLSRDCTMISCLTRKAHIAEHDRTKVHVLLLRETKIEIRQY